MIHDWSIHHNKPFRSLAAARIALGAAMLVALLAGERARACSVCACGDPLVAAAEAPGRGQGDLRVALDAEYLTQEAGSEDMPGMTDVLDQYTLRLTGVYSPIEPLNLVVSAPFLRKKMVMKDPGTGSTSPMSNLSGIGDLEVGARYFVLESTNFAERRRQGLAISLGTSIPTGGSNATTTDEMGTVVRIDDHGQLGTGAWGPYAGVSYRLLQDPWTGLVSVTGRLRTENSHGYKFGNSLLWTVQGQWSATQGIALGLAIEGRNVGQDRLDGDYVPNTGGLVLAATPSVYLNVTRNLWLNARAQLPFAASLVGDQKIGPVVLFGMAYQVL